MLEVVEMASLMEQILMFLLYQQLHSVQVVAQPQLIQILEKQHTRVVLGQLINMFLMTDMFYNKGLDRSLLFILCMCFLPFMSQGRGSDSIHTKVKNKILFYNIKTDYNIVKDKVLRLEMFPEINSFNYHQKTMSYDFCQSINECEKSYELNKDGTKFMTHNSLTGYIQTDTSLWLHPPREDSYRILELNAFPYIEINQNYWQYILNFDDKWSDKNWIQWEGNRTSVSDYKLDEKSVVYKLGDQEIVCRKISATTKIEKLGETKSTFYYNAKYGFVRMIFNTINNKTIEFNLIKAVHDSNIK